MDCADVRVVDESNEASKTRNTVEQSASLQTRFTHAPCSAVSTLVCYQWRSFVWSQCTNSLTSVENLIHTPRRLHTTAGGPPSRPLSTHPSIHPSIHPWFSIPCWLVICRVAVTMSCVRYSRVCRSAVRWALWFRLRSWQTMNIHMYVDWLCAGLCDSAWDRDKQWRHWCHRLSAVNHPVRWSGCYDRSVCARHRPYVTLSPSHYCYMSHSFNVCVDWFTL